MKTLLTTLLVVGGCAILSAQEPLNLPNPQYHPYKVEALPEELYRFPADPLIERLIDTLLVRTGNTRTFTTYASNVPAVTAVQTDNGAFLVLASKN